MSRESHPAPVRHLLQQVQQSLDVHALLPAGTPVLVAISGGPDSVFLAWALRELGYPIGLAHVNYMLRGSDSEWEEALVRRYAQTWGVPLHLRQASPRAQVADSKDSLQMVARDLRYSFFDELLAAGPYPYCATAHHAGDQTETLLMQWFRGDPHSPWTGIPRQRGPYLRPLLDIHKADILQALASLGLAYGEDRSNASTDYLRNQIRHELIPPLQALQPQLGPQLLARQAWLQRQQAFLTHLMEPVLAAALRPDGPATRLDWQGFVQAHGPEALPLFVHEALTAWGIHGHLRQQCLDLIPAQPGRYVDTPAGRVQRSRHGLTLLPSAHPSQGPLHFSAPPLAFSGTYHGRSVQLHGPLPPPDQLGTPGHHYLDASQLAWPLTLRPWAPGDRMVPLGMRGHKKLQDIFTDEKFTPGQKARALVLADQAGIVALSDYRIAARVRIQPHTHQVLAFVTGP